MNIQAFEAKQKGGSAWLDVKLRSVRFDLARITEAQLRQLQKEISDYVWAEPECNHRERLVYKPDYYGNKRFYKQCAVCNNLTTSQIAKTKLSEDQMRNAPERVEEDQTQVYSIKNALYDALKKQLNDQINTAWWKWYNGYLNSPEWASKRRLVLKRANNICEGCGTNPATQIHHLTYDHAGHELLFELVAVCNTCHKVLHPD